jgi:two-component system sensor histidine kinase/response regulator
VFVTWNRGAEKIYGYSAEEAIGQPLDLIVPPDERDREHGRWRQLLDQQPVTSLETVRTTKDRRKVVVAVTRSLITDAGGDIVGVASVGRDITEVKRAQAMLAAAHAEAVEASKLKSQFMANMNHELRTPLNGVIGISQLLLDTELTAEQREYAEALRISGEALLGVIGDILDFSKVEAGKLELVDEPFTLRDLVEDVCAMVALGAPSSDVRLMSLVAPGLPACVLGDEKRLRQVLTNLAGNAVKFTAEGEVTITVDRTVSDDGADELRFEVSDTGIGITPAAQQTIFESFKQADGSTTRRYGGTGLGLTIARQLVTLMDGRIGVTSVLDEGSTFWFTVPLRPASPAAPTPPTLSGARVLVADRHPASRRIVAQELASAGADTVTAPEREQMLYALRAAAEAGAPIDVVVLDTERGGGPDGGLDAVTTDPALGSPRVVLLTSAHDVRVASNNPGVCGLIPVPVRQDRLIREVAAAAASERHPMGASGAPPAVAPDHPDRSWRVLVAEDNPINQLVARRLLEQRGFDVDIAANGREAVEMHMRAPYDVIFMDCQMPELDGYDATRAIRSLEPQGSHTPVIAMTASTTPGDTQRCFDAGMDRFAGKPISPTELDALLVEVLGQAAVSAAAR